MEIIYRLKEIINYKSKSVLDFSQIIGVNQVTLNNQLLGKRKLSLDTIKSILIKIPEISSEWLLRGNGEMIIKTSVVSDPYVHYEKVSNTLEDEIKRLREELKEAYIEIGRLQGENRLLREQVGFGERRASNM